MRQLRSTAAAGDAKGGRRGDSGAREHEPQDTHCGGPGEPEARHASRRL